MFKVKPIVATNFEKLLVLPNTDLVLSCNVSANVNGSITWLFNNVSISTEKFLFNSERKSLTTLIEAKNYGLYECNFKNEIGFANKLIQVTKLSQLNLNFNFLLLLKFLN